ncbi:ABC transporter ATP-binding protein [Ramlibacter sp. G-1-2-2]|uniref:ABC transporter ATP-binding protein n=1 Tax=Ramlibacter agri TaxID=2728837 RepID=A0A848H851_9BURK|nr:ABC transporter ATP-binding protein [Ramlibacter agri]NML46647.1 ABC transporter ATP-binding protein [Ramlibacter agri]
MLQARQLAIGYPGRRVGAGFDVDLDAGSVLALLGPNGGGKTTLLKTLLGLIPAQGGEVLLEGQAIARVPLRERALRLAYVPQAAATGFGFPAREVVLMGRTAHGGLLARPGARDHAVVDQSLQRLGIMALAERPINELSGGERQLVLVARALAQEPRAVILDEPTASLDFGNQGRVLREIRRLADDGLAVLFTTHDPNHALRFADRVLLMRDGATLAQGPVAELVRREQLQALYGAAVEEVGSGNGRAFLPA